MAMIIIPSARAESVLLQDDFNDVPAGTRPSPPYEFQNLPPTPPSSDGLIVQDAETSFLAMQRLEPNQEFPIPSITRVFPRLQFEGGQEFVLSFDLRIKSETGTTLQFHIRNAGSGPDGDGQMVYFKPAQGFWLLDSTKAKHLIVDHALDIGVWYHVSMTLDLAKRTAQVTVSDAKSGETLGESPQIDLYGTTATYLDRFVIARAENHVVYDYEFTNFTLAEK